MSDLCDKCSRLKLVSDSYEKHLGLYKDLVQKSKSLGPGREGCGGCAFFIDVLRNSYRWSYRLDELEPMWITFNSFSFLEVEANKPERKHDSGVNSLPDMQLDRCTAEGVSDPDANPEVDCKRPVVVDPTDPRCFDTARSWIKNCAGHSGCAQAVPVRMPKRVIEISADPTQLPRLVVTTDEQLGQYVVLSHCWGSLGPAKLTNELLPQFQEGIPAEQLPKSFLHAITITRQLSFRYLWIDALCIIQNNAADWAREAPKMALYYGRSALMIAATVAGDSSQGIFHDRHVPYSPIMGREERYCLRQRLLRWDWDIKWSILATRGWAAQERMLAPRIIHYTGRQMIWECAEGFTFEASGIQDTQWGSARPDVQYCKSKMQAFVTQGLGMSYNTPCTAQSQSSPGSVLRITQDPIARIRGWQQCVDEFAKRQLTVSSDKLHAISGIASIMNFEDQMGTYLAGLWSKHLSIGLTWARCFPLLTSPNEYRAPSWSWASLDGDTATTVLASPPEVLHLPDTAIWRKWRSTFELEFVESGIKLEDPGNLYGAVLEGSYIVVDATCIPAEGFQDFCNMQAGYATVVFDKSNAADCPCCGAPDLEDGEGESEEEDAEDADQDAERSDAEDLQEEIDASKPEETDKDTEQPEPAEAKDDENSLAAYSVPSDIQFQKRRPPRDPSDAHFDLAMYLIADEWFASSGFVDFMLLAWVDEEKRVARRTGFARKNIYALEEHDEAFAERIMERSWERMRLKLV